MDEPIADASRAILDGHLVLSRRLASRGHYPPVDVMESISRVMKDVVRPVHWQTAMELKAMMAAYNEAEDLINIGAYAQGSNPQIDRALRYVDPIVEYLQQGADGGEGFDRHVQRMMGIMAAEEAAAPE